MKKILVEDGVAHEYDARLEDINYLNWLIDYFCLKRKDIKKLIDLAHSLVEEFND